MPRYVTELTSDDGLTYLIRDTNAQVTLVSGQNIKTVNGKSLLGSGDISGLPDWFGTTMASAQNMSLASGSSYTTMDTISITPGRWIITYYAEFITQNANGERGALISAHQNDNRERWNRAVSTAKPLSGERTICGGTFVADISTAGDLYINVFQTSGATLAVTIGYHCTRIG